MMDIARLWRQQPSSLRLQGCRCSACETIVFPERYRCPKCRGDKLEPFQFKGTGTLRAATTVYEAPHGFAGQVPYVAGIIELDEGPMVSAMVTDVDPEEVVVGMRVEMVTRRIRCDGADSPILYGYKFAPVAAP